MKKKWKSLFFLAGFVIIFLIAGCYNNGLGKVTVNKDVYTMLEYLELEDCVITKLVLNDSDTENNTKIEERLDEIRSNSRFNLSEGQVTEYATNLGLSITSDYVLYQNIDLNDYLNTFYGVSSSEFFEQCYQQAKSEIEYYLVIGAIAEKRGIVPTDKEIEDWCFENDLVRVELDEENLCYVKYYIIEEKVKLSLE